MALHQYIGARYVPKFYENPNGTSEWLPNVIYEPLTIVTFDSNSYTSKKTVPASVGNPANNPEYWAATGNYNAFINEVQEEINTINGSITDINGDISDINGDISSLSSRIDANSSRITTNTNSITNEASNRANADQTINNNLNSEIASRGAADANLQSQIDELVAPSGEAPSVAEVENARVTYNGTTCTSLGNSIRTQSGDNNKKFGQLALNNCVELAAVDTALYNIAPNVLGWAQGSISAGNGSVDETETTRIRTTGLIDINLFSRVIVIPGTGYSFNYYYYDANRNFIDGMANITTSMTFFKSDMQPLGRRYIALVLRTTGGSDSITPSDASHITVNAYPIRQPKKIRVMSYNVGRFNYGNSPSGLAPATADAKIESFKNFLGKYQPDILCMNEFTKTLVQGTDDNSNVIIFDDFFRDAYGRDIVYGNSIRTQTVNYKTSYYNLITQAAPYDEFPVIQIETIINDRPYTIICVHFVVSIDPEGDYATVEDARLAEMTNLLTRVSSLQNVIICGDFNSSSAGEKETFNTMAKAAGLKPVNGDYFSFVPTWPYNDPINCDDNIFVKGNVTVLSREVLVDEVDNLPSDHIPIMTDLLIY